MRLTPRLKGGIAMSTRLYLTIAGVVAIIYGLAFLVFPI